MKKQYLIMRDGQFLTSIFNGCKFAATDLDGAYKYNVKEIAEDIARTLNAKVVEVSR